MVAATQPSSNRPRVITSHEQAGHPHWLFPSTAGFVDGSGWQGVYEHLKKRRPHGVAVVQNPTPAR